MQREKVLENKILEYLSLKGIWAFKIKTMGTFDPRTGTFRRHSKWYKRGVSDILGIYNGKFLAIEVKAPKETSMDGTKKQAGQLSSHQKSFLKEVEEQGGIGIVARSIDDLEQALKKQEISDDQD